eukprot:TRINITY_DN6748_c0_g1_i2.p1 TRINITY_DN6748_c0_g1~~TRINITY_DN6748_c0_g1_i2.p1  ORF type:complete len:1013 (-),score=189.02 TRINITY_DN6748_c0_g1_i2:436-3474(-)
MFLLHGSGRPILRVSTHIALVLFAAVLTSIAHLPTTHGVPLRTATPPPIFADAPRDGPLLSESAASCASAPQLIAVGIPSASQSLCGQARIYNRRSTPYTFASNTASNAKDNSNANAKDNSNANAKDNSNDSPSFQLLQTIDPPDRPRFARFGAALAFADQSLYVGAPARPVSSTLSLGAVYVYVPTRHLDTGLHTDSLTQQAQGSLSAQDLRSSAASENASGDGPLWTLAALLMPRVTDVTAMHNAGFGETIAVDMRRSAVLVGAPRAEHLAGAVYVFSRTVERPTCVNGETLCSFDSSFATSFAASNSSASSTINANSETMSQAHLLDLIRAPDRTDTSFGRAICSHAEWFAIGSDRFLYLYSGAMHLSQVIPSTLADATSVSSIRALAASPWGIAALYSDRLAILLIAPAGNHALHTHSWTLSAIYGDAADLAKTDSQPDMHASMSAVDWERDVLVVSCRDFIMVYQWQAVSGSASSIDGPGSNPASTIPPADLNAQLNLNKNAPLPPGASAPTQASSNLSSVTSLWKSFSMVNAGRWVPVQRIDPPTSLHSVRDFLAFGSEISLLNRHLLLLSTTKPPASSLAGNIFYFPPLSATSDKDGVQPAQAQAGSAPYNGFEIQQFSREASIPYFAQGYGGVGAVVASGEHVVLSRVGCPRRILTACRNGTVEIHSLPFNPQATPTVIGHPSGKKNSLFGARLFLKDSILLIVSRNSDPSDAESGVVYVYSKLQTNEGIRWSTPEALRSRTYQNEEEFGHAITFHDLYAAIGAPNHMSKNDGRLCGAVFLFRRKSVGQWSRNPIRLMADDLEDGDRFGQTLATNANWLVVGNQPYHAEDHAVYIFRMETGWTLTQKLRSYRSSHYAHSLALLDNLLLVGDPSDPLASASAGAVHLYTITPNEAFLYAGHLEPPQPFANMRFGSNVAWIASRSQLIVGSSTCKHHLCPSNRRVEHVFVVADSQRWALASVLEYALDVEVIPGFDLDGDLDTQRAKRFEEDLSDDDFLLADGDVD